MQQQNNPLLCNPETGFCEMPGASTVSKLSGDAFRAEKPVKMIYFTDPICSSCWGIEPQLRRLKLAYKASIDIEYRMGGLLPDWSYNSGGISKPSDVAHHWDEVSAYYDMPIDGDLWLEDPLASSYPPSIAFKAAQIQDQDKAVVFLRQIREMVFLQKKNITRWEHLALAARIAGLNLQLFQNDYEGRAKQLFEEDLQVARQWGVRGFPTIFFSGPVAEQRVVYGSKPYDAYQQAIDEVLPGLSAQPYSREWTDIFTVYPTLTAKEFSEITCTQRFDAEQQLLQLTTEGKLQQSNCKTGAIWSVKN